MPTFECAAILFDMDGVLVDSTALSPAPGTLGSRAGLSILSS